MDLDDLYKRNPTSLVKAVREENIEAVRELLRGGVAHPNSADHRGWTSLHEAASRNQLEIVKMLLEDERTNPEATAHDGDLALNVAVEYNASLGVVAYLAEHTTRFGQEEYASCLLYEAVKKASFAIVQYILTNTSIDIQGHKKFTFCSPVLMALVRNNEKILEVLLDACDDVNNLYDTINQYHRRTILFAIEAGCSPSLIKMLIKKGVFLKFDETCRDCSHSGTCRSALTFAIAMERANIAFELLKHDVDVNLVCESNIALTLAVSLQQKKIVEVLLPVTSLEVIESLSKKPQFRGIICTALSLHDDDILHMLLNHNLSEPILEAPIPIRFFQQGPNLSYSHIGPLAFLLKEKMHSVLNANLSVMKLLISKGLSIEPRKPSYLPPLVATIMNWSKTTDKDLPKRAFKMLLESGVNVDYQSQSVLPDALLAAIYTNNLEAFKMLLPYSRYTPCDIVGVGIEHNKDFLCTFVLKNMIAIDYFLELSDICKDNGVRNRNYVELMRRFCFKVAPLAVTARREVRRCLRTTTNSSEFLSIIGMLEIPDTLKCYLRFM